MRRLRGNDHQLDMLVRTAVARKRASGGHGSARDYRAIDGSIQRFRTLMQTGPHEGASPLRIIAWGTYDTGKPRVRILLDGLREHGVEIVEYHDDIWASVEDKSQVSRPADRAKRLLRWLLAYPSLVLRYLFSGAHDAVFVGYLGHLDVLILWPWAKLRRKAVVWDAFMSLYSTVIQDRRLVSERHPLARILFAWEWVACRAADRIILDTRAHADLFRDLYDLSEDRLAVCLVGVETAHFLPVERAEAPVGKQTRRVLFYGQLIPLHGLSTILKAADLSQVADAEWLIVGDGQDRPLLEARVGEPGTHRGNIRWLRWIPYADLRRSILEADVSLGIFGTSDKAARVIPNKVYQVLATGRPLVTRDSPAIRELLGDEGERYGVTLVPPGDSEALARAIDGVLMDHTAYPPGWQDERRKLVERFSPLSIAEDLLEVFDQVTGP
jgi:glycosyltransferase involved in cell wall biosynthesis